MNVNKETQNWHFYTNTLAHTNDITSCLLSLLRRECKKGLFEVHYPTILNNSRE